MTTRGREAAVRSCLECSIDHHHACSRAIEDDAGGWSTVYCCCGLAVDPKTTAAEDAEYPAYAEELRRRGWTQPAPGHRPAAGGEQLIAAALPLGFSHRLVGSAWVRSLRHQILAGKVAFFTQCSGPTSGAGGRLLEDGLSWDQYPTQPDQGTTAP